MSAPAAIMLGAILVVSGPTVMGSLLDFVRPAQRVQERLMWEGFTDRPGRRQIQCGDRRRRGQRGAVVAAAELNLGDVLGTQATIACVIAVAAACDIVRDDTGLVAAIIMGMAVANLPACDVQVRRPFFQTVIQMTIGVLFISISATVAPDSINGVVLPTLGLVAVLVLVARPLVALLSTVRTDSSRGERGFIGWMDPRGIVAASTASAFSATLVANGVEGASKILPATFLVIVATVPSTD
jgi:NhaP-type Na+/H+ or K+/H+ antiporter